MLADVPPRTRYGAGRCVVGGVLSHERGERGRFENRAEEVCCRVAIPADQWAAEETGA